ncbi:hypothetical protein [Flavisolibacter ginsengisoli]|jgi:hypothetical protein|uniref:Lipoprotein n=1 Tax=Flavisolibacter ginsengisoli DSM 18119 TaxID=1121884 RepID=A0A1M4ZMK9_9BACT|nr:hypothetical protein [Flavisolibacter ginsengisoli]SHF19032.1 hypothetical protein SAMN02745131_01994 [Flavisolibacter ginsengisoli DSM 18119]
MFKSLSFTLTLLFSLLFVSCSQSENYKEAYGYEVNGQTFIKLKGKSQLAAHDPGSVLGNKKYEDSLLLQIPSLGNGIIEGKDIPVRQGYYKYIRNVIIKDGKVRINLSYDNTDDKKMEPLAWNGEYVLVRN